MAYPTGRRRHFIRNSILVVILTVNTILGGLALFDTLTSSTLYLRFTQPLFLMPWAVIELISTCSLFTLFLRALGSTLNRVVSKLDGHPRIFVPSKVSAKGWLAAITLGAASWSSASVALTYAIYLGVPVLSPYLVISCSQLGTHLAQYSIFHVCMTSLLPSSQPYEIALLIFSTMFLGIMAGEWLLGRKKGGFFLLVLVFIIGSFSFLVLAAIGYAVYSGVSQLENLILGRMGSPALQGLAGQVLSSAIAGFMIGALTAIIQTRWMRPTGSAALAIAICLIAPSASYMLQLTYPQIWPSIIFVWVGSLASSILIYRITRRWDWHFLEENRNLVVHQKSAGEFKVGLKEILTKKTTLQRRAERHKGSRT